MAAKFAIGIDEIHTPLIESGFNAIGGVLDSSEAAVQRTWMCRSAGRDGW